jgi:imidazole glycerol-phosphate synthase subunit HisH
MVKKIGIVDYGCGNLASLHNSLQKINCKFGYISRTEDFDLFDSYILPGVGAYKYGMNSLIDNEMDLSLLDEIKKGKELLGICLGMQLLFESSTEGGYQKGLAFVPGSVDRIEVPQGCRVPHMGWNDLSVNEVNNVQLFNGIDKESSYYFIHSYCAIAEKSVSQVTTTYCQKKILSAFEYENVSGVQFHPEKSHDAGLKLLDNYCKR